MNPLTKQDVYRHVFLLLFCTFFLISLTGNKLKAQDKNFYAGLSVGIIPGGNESVWIGPDINRWANRNASFIYQLNAGYRISGYAKAGIYVENELAKIEIAGMAVESINRWAFGLQWMGNYPDNPLQWQLGGYVGLGPAGYSDGTAKFFGFEDGFITGPAYEKDKFGIALHLHAGFGWYSGSDIPDEFSVHDPRLFLKTYYKF